MKRTKQQKAERYTQILKVFAANPESVWAGFNVWYEERRVRNRKTPRFLVLFQHPNQSSHERQSREIF